MLRATASWRRRHRREALLGAGGAVALHALGIWLGLHQPAPVEPQAPRVLTVALLSAPPAVAAPVPPAAIPPEPRPAAAQPTAVRRPPSRPGPSQQWAVRPRPTRVLAAPPKAAPMVEATSPAAVAASVATSQPNPTAPTASPAAAVVPAAGADQPQTTPPRFDAAYLNNPPPAYPPLSRRLGEQGRVLVRVFVDSSGAPAEVKLHQSSGQRRLDAAAEMAVRHWRFVPARRGHEAVGAWVLVPIAFKLRS